MIRVLLADDHGVIRDGLGRLIGALDDVELIGTAADGAEAVERARALRPDVILMDLDMPVLDGIEATRRIIAERPDAAVLVLTAFSDRARILGALEAGACGYLLKDVASEEVAEGIRAAARGESPLDPRAARTVLTARSQPDPLAGLSQREREVLDALVEGLPEQADRPPAGDQREDRQVAPDADLPRARRHRPHAGRPVGRAARTRTKVSLNSGPARREPSRGCSAVVRSPSSPRRPSRAAAASHAAARCSLELKAADGRIKASFSGADGELVARPRGPRQVAREGQARVLARRLPRRGHA